MSPHSEVLYISKLVNTLMLGDNKQNNNSGLQNQLESDSLLNNKFKNPFLQSIKKIELKPIADPTLETLGEKSLSIDAYQLCNVSKELFDYINTQKNDNNA